MEDVDKEKARKLTEEHWNWIESILVSRHRETEHMFVEGFIHGYKHGEDEERKKV